MAISNRAEKSISQVDQYAAKDLQPLYKQLEAVGDVSQKKKLAELARQKANDAQLMFDNLLQAVPGGNKAKPKNLAAVMGALEKESHTGPVTRSGKQILTAQQYDEYRKAYEERTRARQEAVQAQEEYKQAQQRKTDIEGRIAQRKQYAENAKRSIEGRANATLNGLQSERAYRLKQSENQFYDQRENDAIAYHQKVQNISKATGRQLMKGLGGSAEATTGKLQGLDTQLQNKVVDMKSVDKSSKKPQSLFRRLEMLQKKPAKQCRLVHQVVALVALARQGCIDLGKQGTRMNSLER